MSFSSSNTLDRRKVEPPSYSVAVNGLFARRGSSASTSSQKSSISARSTNSWNEIVSPSSDAIAQSGERKCFVHLLDARKIEFSYKNALTIQELFDIACSQVIIHEKQYFGLYTYDDHLNRHWLDMKLKATACILNSSRRHFDVFLGVKFFVPDYRQLSHFTTLELFYLECRKLVYQGEITASWDILHKLIALAIQESFGNFQSQEETEKLITAKPLLSFPDNSTALKEECAWKVSVQHEQLLGVSRGEAIVQYMGVVQQLPLYGLHLYPVKTKGVAKGWVSVGLKGLQQWAEQAEENSLSPLDFVLTPLTMYTWSGITNMKQVGKELTVEVEQTWNNSLSQVWDRVQVGSNALFDKEIQSSNCSAPTDSREASHNSRRLFSALNPARVALVGGHLQRGGGVSELGSTFGKWSSTVNVSWTGKNVDLMKNLFNLAQDHHKFYLSYTFLDCRATSSAEDHINISSPNSPVTLNSTPTQGNHHIDAPSSPISVRGTSPFQRSQILARKMVLNGICMGDATSNNSHRSLNDLSKSQLSINSSGAFSDSAYNMAPSGGHHGSNRSSHPKAVCTSVSDSLTSRSTGGVVVGRRGEGHRVDSGAGLSFKDEDSSHTEGSRSTSLSMISGASGAEFGGGAASVEALQDLVVAFSAQRDALLDRLRNKLEQLKEVCLQESEITGVLPMEYPVSPGTTPPPPRKRVGTAFELSETVLLSVDRLALHSRRGKGGSASTAADAADHRVSGGGAASGEDRLAMLEAERAQLQTEMDIKSQIVKAEKKLLSENKSVKRGQRKQRKNNIARMEVEIADMNFRLVQLKRDINNFSVESEDSRNASPHPQIYMMSPLGVNNNPANRNRAHSVTERLRNKIAIGSSTDALNVSTPVNNNHQMSGSKTMRVKNLPKHEQMSPDHLISSTPSSPTPVRRDNCGGGLGSRNREEDQSEEHDFSTGGGDSFSHSDITPTSAFFRSDLMSALSSSTRTPDMSRAKRSLAFLPGEINTHRYSQEERMISHFDDISEGYVPKSSYHVTDYRARNYPSYSAMRNRIKSNDDLLAASTSSNNWRQPYIGPPSSSHVQPHQQKSTVSLNLAPGPNQLSSFSSSSVLSSSCLAASNTSFNSNISTNPPCEHTSSSVSSISSGNNNPNFVTGGYLRHFALPYASPRSTVNSKSSSNISSNNYQNLPFNSSVINSSGYTSPMKARAMPNLPSAPILPQSQSLHAFNMSCSPLKHQAASFLNDPSDVTMDSECSRMSSTSTMTHSANSETCIAGRASEPRFEVAKAVQQRPNSERPIKYQL